MSTIIDRIEQFIDYKKTSTRQFEKAIGASNGVISTAIKNKKDIRASWMSIIIKSFPELSAQWLLTGQGDMLSEKNGSNSENNYTISEDKPLTMVGEPAVVTVNQYGDPNIVQIDSKAAAGWPAHINDPEFYQDLPAFTLPGAQWRNNDYVFIEIVGDSMHPTIYHGNWVIAKRITDFSHLREGYVHIVVTSEGVNCKRVLNRINKRGTLVLKSDNKEYPTYEERGEEVLQIYEAVCQMSWNFINKGETLQHQINSIFERLDRNNIK